MNSNDLIVEIFNKMNFERKPVPGSDSRYKNSALNESVPHYIYESLKNDRKPKSFANAVADAKEALETWKSFSAKERAESLHKVWEGLVKKSKSLPQLKNELSVLIDYFDFYTDMAEEMEENVGEPVGIVLIVLPPQLSFYIIAAAVPVALAAGCTVIIHTDKQAVIPLFLEKLIYEAGLPVGVVNVVADTIDKADCFLFDRILYCGSASHGQASHLKGKYESLKYFHPNNTTAFVLESCDLNAAVAEIFYQTWECPSLWRVSTVVVQESILQKFLDKLKSRMELSINMGSDFESKEILERINDVISKAVKAGASVEKCSRNESEWGPTALVNYQSQEEDLPILNVLACRSAEEGVKLLNNCMYAFCTSVWSEFSAQALEIASKLNSPNIWINSHGMFDAKVPLVTTGLGGNWVFGGAQDILQYLSYKHRLPPSVDKITSVSTLEETHSLEITLSAQKAFDSWKNKSKRTFFEALEKFLETQQGPSLLQRIKNLRRVTNNSKFSEKNYTDDFFIVHKKEPIGVICLFISSDIDSTSFVFFIILPIKLGNAVILCTENQHLIQMANMFEKFFPKNLLTVISNKESGFRIAEDPIVQAVWGDCLRYPVKGNFSKSLWTALPENPSSFQDLIIKQCMRYKIIWLPKVEKFP